MTEQNLSNYSSEDIMAFVSTWPSVKWVMIATKAYQQACKYENISLKQREQLFHFIHDWFRMIVDENEALASGEESPEQMFTRMTVSLNKGDPK